MGVWGLAPEETFEEMASRILENASLQNPICLALIQDLSPEMEA